MIYVELKEKGKTGIIEGIMFYNGKARVQKIKAQELIQKGLVWCDALGCKNDETTKERDNSNGMPRKQNEKIKKTRNR